MSYICHAVLNHIHTMILNDYIDFAICVEGAIDRLLYAYHYLDISDFDDVIELLNKLKDANVDSNDNKLKHLKDMLVLYCDEIDTLQKFYYMKERWWLHEFHKHQYDRVDYVPVFQFEPCHRTHLIKALNPYDDRYKGPTIDNMLTCMTLLWYELKTFICSLTPK